MRALCQGGIARGSNELCFNRRAVSRTPPQGTPSGVPDETKFHVIPSPQGVGISVGHGFFRAAYAFPSEGKWDRLRWMRYIIGALRPLIRNSEFEINKRGRQVAAPTVKFGFA